jgi:hypothetical protein
MKYINSAILVIAVCFKKTCRGRIAYKKTYVHELWYVPIIPKPHSDHKTKILTEAAKSRHSYN